MIKSEPPPSDAVYCQTQNKRDAKIEEVNRWRFREFQAYVVNDLVESFLFSFLFFMWEIVNTMTKDGRFQTLNDKMQELLKGRVIKEQANIFFKSKTKPFRQHLHPPFSFYFKNVHRILSFSNE